MPDIHVADYDPEWPRQFDEVSSFVWPAVAGTASRLEHVGSTSVPGLASKPIIDVDVVATQVLDVPLVAEAVVGLGYVALGDLGVTGREAFDGSQFALPSHHLFVVVDGSKPYLDHVLLREWLRTHTVDRDRYAALKRRNAVASSGDVAVYTARKAGFVAELLARARTEKGLAPSAYWVPTAAELG